MIHGNVDIHVLRQIHFLDGIVNRIGEDQQILARFFHDLDTDRFLRFDIPVGRALTVRCSEIILTCTRFLILKAVLDAGNIAHVNGGTVLAGAHNQVEYIGRSFKFSRGAHDNAVGAPLGDAGAHIAVGSRQHPLHLVHGEIVKADPVRIDFHKDFTLAAAPQFDIQDRGDTLERILNFFRQFIQLRVGNPFASDHV